MGLRAKLATVFIPLLVAAVVAVSAAEVDHSADVMVDTLHDFGSIFISQTFEQIRTALADAKGDPLQTLRNDASLSALLASSQAFGKAVVYARIETPDGGFITGVPADGEQVARLHPEPFSALKAAVERRWWPLARIAPLWGDHVYEISSPVELNGHPFAVIKVGLSTALVSADITRTIINIALIGAVVIAMSLLGALLSGALLLRPVAAITAGVERLASGADTGNVRVGGRDELGALAEKFNVLAQKVRADRTQWEDERGQFMDVFRSIADAVILLDADGLIRFTNEEAHGRLGLPAGGMAYGKPLATFLGGDHPVVRLARNVAASGVEMRDVAVEIGAGDKSTRLLASAFPLGRRAGSPVLVIVRDLKPVRELENVVEDSGRLARLGTLISGVAHQIRTPLNAMTLELELLNQDIHESRPIEDRVHMVRDEMRRLGQAIDALMRFMRPEQLHLEELDLNATLTELAHEVGDSKIKVSWRLDPLRPKVNADRAVLMEACRNVIQNAIEAMPKGGDLILASRAEDDGFATLSISDSGQGIRPEILENIFQLYFTTKEDGTGIGLPLALRAVDLHGGTIKVDSQPGKGTTVTIRLPVEGPASSYRSSSSASRGQFNS